VNLPVGAAKRELGWTPRYASWREGFPAVYSARKQPRAQPIPVAHPGSR
jgi:hypothetical protein